MKSKSPLPSSRFGIGEWYGNRFTKMDTACRSELAATALKSFGLTAASATPEAANQDEILCPFRYGEKLCTKRGGVCSIQRYDSTESGRIRDLVGDSVVTCPHRFEENNTLLFWLAEIVRFRGEKIQFAREVPFMTSEITNRPAGKLDWVIAEQTRGELKWCALEIQSVYFSGKGMDSEFRTLEADSQIDPPIPSSIRRPDWRSSSAKRLMPQLQVKVPTLRRWGSKLAVAVDGPFFNAIGGKSDRPSHDLNDGDVIWMIPRFVRYRGRLKLVRGDWEVLTLEQSSKKLLSAKTVSRRDFEDSLRSKLTALSRI